MEKKPFFETGHFRRPEEVARLFKIPEDPNLIPNIVVFVSPARSGSTALLAVMAGHPGVDKAYFQPWKFGLRHGGETIVDPVGPNDKGVVFMKETLGPIDDAEIFDPIKILMIAGVPIDKIRGVIFGLRNPLNAIASLDHYVPGGQNIEYYAKMQKYIIDLYLNYKQIIGKKAVPFVFDLLEGGEFDFLKRVLDRVGLGEIFQESHLSFDSRALGVDNDWNLIIPSPEGVKVRWGEALNPTYFQEAVYSTLRQGRFRYVGGTHKKPNISLEREKEILSLCGDDYYNFLDLAKGDLGF